MDSAAATKVSRARGNTSVTRVTRQPKKAKPSSSLHPDGTSSSPPRSPALCSTPDLPAAAFQVSSAPAKRTRKSVSRDGDRDPGEADAAHEQSEEPTPTKRGRRPRPNENRTPSSASAPSLLLSAPASDKASPRPKVKQRCVSAPTPLATEPLNIDHEIRQLLRKGPKNPEEQDQADNYVFVDSTTRKGRSIYKIGVSVDTKERLRELNSQCLYKLRKAKGSCLTPIRHYAMVEKLVHKELDSFRYRERCPGYSTKCTTKDHREYFEVPTLEMTLEVVNRWHAFSKSEPWDDSGKLLPKWKARLDHRDELQDGYSHDELVKAWREFTSPTVAQTLAYDADVLSKHFGPYRYHMLSFLVILYFSSISPWARIWLFVVAYSVMVESVPLGHSWLFDSLFKSGWYGSIHGKAPPKKEDGAGGEKPETSEQPEGSPGAQGSNTRKEGAEEQARRTEEDVEMTMEEEEDEEMHDVAEQGRSLSPWRRPKEGSFECPIEFSSSDDDDSDDGSDEEGSLPPLP